MDEVTERPSSYRRRRKSVDLGGGTRGTIIPTYVGHLALAGRGEGRRWKEERKGYARDGGYAARGRISPRSGDQKRARAFDAPVILRDPHRPGRVRAETCVRMTITLGKNKELWRKNFIPAPCDTIFHGFHFFDFAQSFSPSPPLPLSLFLAREKQFSPRSCETFAERVANKHSKEFILLLVSGVLARFENNTQSGREKSPPILSV